MPSERGRVYLRVRQIKNKSGGTLPFWTETRQTMDDYWLDTKEVFGPLQSRAGGLSTEEAGTRYRPHGPNRISEREKE